ncbi:hypothetical protein FNYG_07854 [Fusarium nygamai]|uniref:Uncharacterized protein n=1 Tax=Gibberella nygamai TaxID=42673 RepID=A0A2K0W8U7_GIBNY|nr:hypothetical protein FNYG_07854 [Fusarium nygamai]
MAALPTADFRVQYHPGGSRNGGNATPRKVRQVSISEQRTGLTITTFQGHNINGKKLAEKAEAGEIASSEFPNHIFAWPLLLQVR